MGLFPGMRRRRYFISRGLQGGFVIGLAVIVGLGLLLDFTASYFLIDRTLDARLYKIHLQANSTLDIIWPVIWKLSIASAFFIALGGLVLAFFLVRRLEAGLAPYLSAMKKAGDGDFTARVESGARGLSDVRESFNMAMAVFGARFAVIKDLSRGIEQSMGEISRSMEAPGSALKVDTLRQRLTVMAIASDEAIDELSKFRV